MSSHVTPSIKKGKKEKTRHALRDRCRRSNGKNPCREKQEEISSERNSYSCQRTRGGLTNVTGKIARKESPVFVLSTSTSRPNRSIHHTCTRSRTTLNSPPPCIPRIARRTIPFRPVPRPSRHRKIDKSSPSPACFSYVSIHTTCQPIVNHYCTFFAFMIFYTLLFLIIFFVR